MNLLLLGSDSYIGNNFREMYKNEFSIVSISPKATANRDDIHINDLFNIDDKYFQNTDIVYNCIGIAHQNNAPEELYYKINYDLAVVFAEKAKKNGVKTFVQMSTVSVYGNNECIEDSTEETPLTAYGKSKHQFDKKLLSLQDGDFKVLSVRPPMVYGESCPGNMQKLVKLVSYIPVLPFKNINNKRDYIYVKNLVYFIGSAIKQELSGICLITDNNPVSTEELVMKLVAGIRSRKYYFSMPGFLRNLIKILLPGYYFKFFSNLAIDISHTVAQLKCPYPLYSLDDGINNMLNLVIEPNQSLD